MRGFSTWVIVALVAVLLQGAAAAKVSHTLKDEGMANGSTEMRQIAVSSSVVRIDTDPQGLVYGPTSAKDGILKYKITLRKSSRVRVRVWFADGISKEIIVRNPLRWAPAQPAQVAARLAKGKSTDGSQSSVSTRRSQYWNLGVKQPWRSLWEINADYTQDTRGWFGDNADGTMTHGNLQIRNMYQIREGLGLFWETDFSKTSDLSVDWANSAHNDDGLAGAGLGLKLWPVSNQSLAFGIRYNFLVPQGTSASLPINPYVEYEGNLDHLHLKVVGTTDALKAWGGYAQADYQLHGVGISVVAMGKKLQDATHEGQIGVGPMWYVGDAKAAVYILTPTTPNAPPAFGATIQIPIKLQ